MILLPFQRFRPFIHTTPPVAPEEPTLFRILSTSLMFPYAVESTQQVETNEETVTTWELTGGALPEGISFNQQDGTFTGTHLNPFRITNPRNDVYFPVARGVNYDAIYTVGTTGRGTPTFEVIGELPDGIAIHTNVIRGAVVRDVQPLEWSEPGEPEPEPVETIYKVVADDDNWRLISRNYAHDHGTLWQVREVIGFDDADSYIKLSALDAYSQHGWDDSEFSYNYLPLTDADAYDGTSSGLGASWVSGLKYTDTRRFSSSDPSWFTVMSPVELKTLSICTSAMYIDFGIEFPRYIKIYKSYDGIDFIYIDRFYVPNTAYNWVHCNLI